MKPVLAPSLSLSQLGRRAAPPTIARLMTMALEQPGLLSLAAGFTDNATLPVGAVQAAVGALADRPGEAEFLQYGTNQGRPQLRRRLADRLAAVEPPLNAADLAPRILITNGSQQALYLAIQTLCDPGDIVLVDRPSYFVFLEMLAGLGVRAVSLPTDSRGRLDGAALDVRLTELARRGEAERVKAVYFISYFSNPSARSLTGAEKISLAEILSRHGLVVPAIEDAAYRELYFDRPEEARSILSLPAWREFPQLYLSTLTKPFASGLKTGWGVCTDETWLGAMLNAKGHHDFGTANFNQAVCEQVLANGVFAAQVKKVRSVYAAKMAVLHATLETAGLRDCGWRWEQPAGGLYLWLEAPPGLDTGLESAFCRACIDAGVIYVPGELCFADDVPRNFVRLSFGVLGEGDLREAGRRFAAAARGLA
ncbi:MAG TPA: PLP-dependent aminotransferase family protein [Opitutaceae bacterium]|nr:PLP-dependent aminotransferase family protein [Opitutaceae bacterium]